ncbi:MAG: MFS transporter [Chloroflexi bacterium]|nr:MFS transporter [Chloroflexota bacterium]
MRDSRTVLRLIGTLLAGQGLAATALVAAGTVVAIAARNLSGDARLAGVPGTLETLGAALSAYPAGRLMDRFGRRNGLTGGFALGALGGALTVLAVIRGDFLLLLAGYLLFGLSRGVTSLGRFAAAEIAAPENRAKAVSWVVLGGTFGAIIGPALVKPSGDMAVGWGASELAGPFLAAVGLFVIAGAAMFVLLRPDPTQVARQRDLAVELSGAPDPGTEQPARTFLQVLRLRRARLAVAAMMLGYWVMVAVMVVTPLHMDEGHHGLDAISGVIGAHVFGMFAFSLVTGRLADRFGAALHRDAGFKLRGPQQSAAD